MNEYYEAIFVYHKNDSNKYLNLCSWGLYLVPITKLVCLGHNLGQTRKLRHILQQKKTRTDVVLFIFSGKILNYQSCNSLLEYSPQLFWSKCNKSTRSNCWDLEILPQFKGILHKRCYWCSWQIASLRLQTNIQINL